MKFRDIFVSAKPVAILKKSPTGTLKGAPNHSMGCDHLPRGIPRVQGVPMCHKGHPNALDGVPPRVKRAPLWRHERPHGFMGPPFWHYTGSYTTLDPPSTAHHVSPSGKPLIFHKYIFNVGLTCQFSGHLEVYKYSFYFYSRYTYMYKMAYKWGK